MAAVECRYEQDVLDAVITGRWPARCDDELRNHVASCQLCSDLAAVVAPLTEARDEIWPEIRVPSPGTVWWRAQVRARQEAARKASRPMTVVHVAATAAAALVVIGLCYALVPWLASLSLPRFELPTLPELPSLNASLRVPTVTDLGLWGWAAVAAVVTWAVLAPLVIYLADAED